MTSRLRISAIGCLVLCGLWGCKTYEVTVLDRATGKPPENVTISFNYVGMLMIGKAFSGPLSIDTEGLACASIGSPNASQQLISVIVYRAPLEEVEENFRARRNGDKHTDFLPRAVFQAQTPAKNQRAEAILTMPEYREPFWHNLEIWVERK